MFQGTESYYIEQLKRKLEGKIGFQILQFHDCRVFSALLTKEKITVSAHTLARFFGLMKENHRPYTSTLDLLSDFLGFESFAFFCNDIAKSNAYSLADPRSLVSGDFSFTALELAIHSNDWKSVQILLDSFEFKCGTEKNDMTMFLGNAVRQHPEKDDFLKALIEFENGRHLFYESFVDEDDPGGYYSEALLKYYLKTKKEVESNLFQACFVNAKKIYLNQKVESKELDLIRFESLQMDKLHFHQISRLFEMRILIDSLNDNSIHKIDRYIDEVLNLLTKYTAYEKSWILARMIKALAYTRKLKTALKIKEFKTSIYQTYLELNGKLESIAELILQLTVNAYRNTFEAEVFPLARIQEKHLNETNARVAIEATTAYLFAEKPIKSIIEKNLVPFSQATGNSWVVNLLEISS
jgi:hypothetical protein